MISVMAAAALYAAPQVEGQPPTSPPDEWIVVSSGPFWMPAQPGPTTSSYFCGLQEIRFRYLHWPRSGNLPERLEIDWLSVDGRRIGRERLAAINFALAGFRVPPEIRPQCTRRQIRIMLEETERGRVVRSHFVPLVAPQ